MKPQQITFLALGMTAGLVCTILGALGSPEIAIITLTYGVGPLFFVAVFTGIVITGAWRYIRPGFLRYLVGLIVCIITYFAALMAFLAVFGFSPDWIGFRKSDNIAQFGIDVWLALIAAGGVGATGIALFTAVLTGRWNNALLRRLILAGIVTICVTFIANLPFHKDWSFLGVLLPLGNALFCCLVGTETLRHHAPTKLDRAADIR